MFTVFNMSGIKIANFRTREQIAAWAKRVELSIENLTITYNAKLINTNEWTHASYR